MRMIAAAGAIALLASPAAAQRLDTTRIDISHPPGSTLAARGHLCSFEAYPEVRLIIASFSYQHSFAEWSSAPAEDPDARLQLLWTAASGDWRSPPFALVEFQMSDGGVVNADMIGGGELILDGHKAIPLHYFASHGGLFFRAMENIDSVGAQMVGSNLAALQIYDKAGAPLRRFNWDISRLANAVETVSVVGWSCTSP
jgi:hypothetical protein